jgi:cytochrome c oxidase subunit 2
MTAMLVFKRLTALAVMSGALLAGAGAALAEAGRPTNWQLGLQESATPVMDTIISFHNYLLIVITLITLFVLALLMVIVVRFNAKANPTPRRLPGSAGCSPAPQNGIVEGAPSFSR